MRARLVDVDGSERIRERLSRHVTLRAAWVPGKCGVWEYVAAVSDLDTDVLSCVNSRLIVVVGF